MGVDGTSALERGTPQASQSRRSDRSPSSSAGGAPAALLLSLQQTAGNGAVRGFVHRAAAVRAGMVQRDASYRKRDRKATAVIHDSGNPITVEGTNVDKATGATSALTGALTFSETRVPGKAVGDESFFSKLRDPAALQINVMDVKPQGTGLGNVLMWHLARYAQERKIDYVVAGNVSAARGPFYEPLGFLDYRNAPSWRSLVAEKARLQQQMVGPSPPPDIGEKYKAVTDAMEANRIFARSERLAAAALQKWTDRWESD